MTLVTRRRAELPEGLVAGPATISPEELANPYGTVPGDLDRVRQILSGFGLEVTSAHPGSRRVKVAGTAAQLTQAFGTTLRRVSSPDPIGTGRVEHRYREGHLVVPAGLAEIVLAVLGLDDRPQVSPHFRLSAAAVTPASYTPPQVAQAYQFPAGTDGTGQTIAILEFGGGFSAIDLQSYFSALGLPVPSVTAASVDGASNAPGSDPGGADGEVLLDIEVAVRVAPGAAQVVYFAPNTDQAFVDAISDAAHATPTPIVISISWAARRTPGRRSPAPRLDQALSDAEPRRSVSGRCSAGGMATEEVADAREKLLSGQSSLKKQAVKRFRDVDDFGTATAEAANQKRDAYDEEAPQYPAEEPAASSRNFEPHLDAEDVNSVDYETWQERLERAYEPEEEQPRALPLVRHRARSMAPADEYERTRRPFSYGGMVRLLVVLIILAGVVGDDILAVVRDHGLLPIRQPYWTRAANPGQPRNAVSAIQILGSRLRRSKAPGRRQARRRRVRKRRRPSRSGSCSTRRTRTISRADATSAPPSGARKHFRRAPD